MVWGELPRWWGHHPLHHHGVDACGVDLEAAGGSACTPDSPPHMQPRNHQIIMHYLYYSLDRISFWSFFDVSRLKGEERVLSTLAQDLRMKSFLVRFGFCLQFFLLLIQNLKQWFVSMHLLLNKTINIMHKTIENINQWIIKHTVKWHTITVQDLQGNPYACQKFLLIEEFSFAFNGICQKIKGN